MNIYLDTNLWNLLCDEQANPKGVVDALDAKGAGLVLSFHTVYELARAFMNSGTNGDQRGAELFSYLTGYLDCHVLITKESPKLLLQELRTFEQRGGIIDWLISDEEYEDLHVEARKLSSGDFSAAAKAFIGDRMIFSAQSRADQREHLIADQQMSERLKKEPVDTLGAMMDYLVPHRAGLHIMRSHLERLLGRDPKNMQFLQDFVTSPMSRAARAIIRGDIYYNWQCAHRGSNPSDLVDDMYHVINSCHCDSYATAEPKQEEYAHLLLPPALTPRSTDATCRFQTGL